MWSTSWLFILVSVVIVTGNISVLVIFTTSPSLRSRKYIFMINLALVDLLVGLISAPMMLCLKECRVDKTFVTAFQVQDVWFGTTSVLGLSAIAIERAFATYAPLKHRTLGYSPYVVAVSLTWGLGLVCALVLPFIPKTTLLIKMVTTAVPIIVPLLSIIIAYLLIWVKVSCMQRIANGLCTAHQERDHKLTITLLIVTAASLIAWFPFQAVMIHGWICNWCVQHTSLAMDIVKCLHYSNSLANPIIYAMRMREFKNAMLRRCRRCRKSNRVSPFVTGNPASHHVRTSDGQSGGK